MPNRTPRALYPGTFDPVTLGHLDLIRRGCELFGRIVVGIAENSAKETVFTSAERAEILREETEGLPVEVDAFTGLVVDYCSRRGIPVILRGLRTVSDFEMEYQMALTNRALAPGIETVFVMPNEKYSYVSTRLLKEILGAGGDVRAFVSPRVERRLRERLEALRSTAGGSRPPSKT
jgi:pantetheine-phosphate adenylyltransferase